MPQSRRRIIELLQVPPWSQLCFLLVLEVEEEINEPDGGKYRSIEGRSPVKQLEDNGRIGVGGIERNEEREREGESEGGRERGRERRERECFQCKTTKF